MQKQPRYKKCLVSDCERNAHYDVSGKCGYCVKHYRRFRKSGDPLVVRKVPSPAQDWLHQHVNYAGDDCLIWPFHRSPKDGYGRVHHPVHYHLMTSSRLMCIMAHGEPPTPKHEAAHKCGKGNQGCTNPLHLYWATPTENQHDRVKHGTSNRGERQGRSKLNRNDVRMIKSLCAAGYSQASIADQFGVDQSAISNIKRGRNWAWLNL